MNGIRYNYDCSDIRKIRPHMDESEAEAWSLGQSEELMALVEQSRQQLHEEGALPLEEMRKELGLEEDE